MHDVPHEEDMLKRDIMVIMKNENGNMLDTGSRNLPRKVDLNTSVAFVLL
jgi:hypothetical protein